MPFVAAADMGWCYDDRRGAWELWSRTGLVVQRVRLDFLREFGPAPLNRYGARRGWPELVPGAAWLHCVLDGGPMDGRHVFFAPGAHAGPPEVLTCEAEAPLPSPPGGPAVPAPRLEVYRRQWRPACTHGGSCAACPFPYRWDAARGRVSDRTRLSGLRQGASLADGDQGLHAGRRPV